MNKIATRDSENSRVKRRTITTSFFKRRAVGCQKVKRNKALANKNAHWGKRNILCIDETGDKKKGKATDYVTRQYTGNLGKTENGIVSVNTYGLVDGITYPLMFEIFKPKNRLKSGYIVISLT